MAQADLRSLPRNDQLFLGLGALVLIASFLPWYGYSFSLKVAGQAFNKSDSTTAWHGWAAFGLLLMLAATALVLVELMTDVTLPRIRLSWNVVVLALDAIGALSIVIKSFDLPSASGPGASIGLRWGGWILIVVAIAQVVVAALRFRASGEPMPWAAQSAPEGSAAEPPAPPPG